MAFVEAMVIEVSTATTPERPIQAGAVPALHLRRGDGAVRLRQAGPALRDGAGRPRARAVDADGAPASGFRVFDEALAAGGRVKAIVAPGHGRRHAPRDRRADRARQAVRGEGPRPPGGRGGRRDPGPDRQVPRRRLGGAARRARPARSRATSSSSSPTRPTSPPTSSAGCGSSSAAGSALADPDVLAYCWVHRFPMYQWDAENGAGTRPTTRSAACCRRTRRCSSRRRGDPCQPVARRSGRPGAGDAVRHRAQRLGARRRLGPDLAARPARAQLRAPGLQPSSRCARSSGRCSRRSSTAPPPHGGIALGHRSLGGAAVATRRTSARSWPSRRPSRAAT